MSCGDVSPTRGYKRLPIGLPSDPALRSEESRCISWSSPCGASARHHRAATCTAGVVDIATQVPVLQPRAHGTDKQQALHSRCTVLIVEDDADLREMMVQLLACEGFESEGASDGAEALRKLRGAGPRPHLILLDMMMPVMDGWTFCREQATDPALRSIPVVVLSAAPREQIRVPAVAVLSKPFDYDMLLTTVRRHC